MRGPAPPAPVPALPRPSAQPLADPSEVARRRALLAAPAHAPLAGFAEALRRAMPGRLVPDLDPLDGGTGARVLLLLEKPGPRVARTGLVSRDNPTGTAAALSAFLQAAGLAREETAIWNAVPGWNGTTRVAAPELREGLSHLAPLLALLPRLDSVILVGARAGRAAPLLPPGLRAIRSDHPSPQVRAAFPERWAAIPEAWAAARLSPAAAPGGPPPPGGSAPAR